MPILSKFQSGLMMDWRDSLVLAFPAGVTQKQTLFPGAALPSARAGTVGLGDTIRTFHLHVSFQMLIKQRSMFFGLFNK